MTEVDALKADVKAVERLEVSHDAWRVRAEQAEQERDAAIRERDAAKVADREKFARVLAEAMEAIKKLREARMSEEKATLTPKWTCSIPHACPSCEGPLTCARCAGYAGSANAAEDRKVTSPHDGRACISVDVDHEARIKALEANAEGKSRRCYECSAKAESPGAWVQLEERIHDIGEAIYKGDFVERLRNIEEAIYNGDLVARILALEALAHGHAGQVPPVAQYAGHCKVCGIGPGAAHIAGCSETEAV